MEAACFYLIILSDICFSPLFFIIINNTEMNILVDKPFIGSLMVCLDKFLEENCRVKSINIYKILVPYCHLAFQNSHANSSRSTTVCTLHATAFALLATILCVAKLSSHFSVFTRLNRQLHLTHWILYSLICLLSSILRFRRHCSVWVVLLLILFLGSLLFSLKLKQRALFYRLFSVYGCCLGGSADSHL